MNSAWLGWPSIFPILEILHEHFFSSRFFPNFLLALLTPLLRHYCSHQTYAFYSFLKVFKKRCKISINTLVKYNITSFSSALKALDSGSSLTVCHKRISLRTFSNFCELYMFRKRPKSFKSRWCTSTAVKLSLSYKLFYQMVALVFLTDHAKSNFWSLKICSHNLCNEKFYGRVGSWDLQVSTIWARRTVQNGRLSLSQDDWWTAW